MCVLFFVFVFFLFLNTFCSPLTPELQWILWTKYQQLNIKENQWVHSKDPKSHAGVFILQENLNYFPALCVVYKILPQLQKLQMHFNQGCRSVFDLVGSDFVLYTRGCLRGDVPPSEAGKFCIFETVIVQFDEYFWEQIYSRWWWVKNQFYRPSWPKFCILGVILVKIVSKNWKSAMFWPKSIDFGLNYLKISQNIFT